MLVPRLAAGLAGPMLALFLNATAAASDGAAYDCPSLPQVSWWDTTPDRIVTYVDKTFQGEWDPYIEKWENYRAQMLRIYERNGAALVRSRNLRLEGDALAAHIRDIEQRLAVTRCLKDKFGGRLAAVSFD